MTDRVGGRVLGLALIWAIMSLLHTGDALGQVFEDSFDGTSIDESSWEICFPIGSSVIVQDDSLFVENHETAGVYCHAPRTFGPGAGIGLIREVRGDFDIEVDWSRFDGPYLNFAQVFLGIYQDEFNQAHIKRMRHAGGDFLQTVIAVDGVVHDNFGNPLSATAGTFRIRRTGSLIETFNSGVPCASLMAWNGPVYVSLTGLAFDDAAVAGVSAAFDNFRINTGELGPAIPCGACCSVDQCNFIPEAACDAAGGRYLGDNIHCDPDPCAAASILEPAAPPQTYFIGPPVPNPFASGTSTSITYEVPMSCDVEIAIYDVSGRMLRSLVRNTVPAGRHLVEWDGRDDNGRAAGSGVYFYSIRAGSFQSQRRIAVLK